MTNDVVEAAIHSSLEYLQLGNPVTVARHATFVHNETAPSVTDANHAAMITAADDDAIDEVLRVADAFFAHCTFNGFRVDPTTPTRFEARLAADGYSSGVDLHMLLTGGITDTGPTIDIRPATTEDEWATVARLKRLDHLETGETANGEPLSDELSAAMARVKRAKLPDVTYFVANVDGIDCAFFSGWPGRNGVAIVEDLFTLPDFRRRGIATALIAHAVAHARERGARYVGISADPTDTPKDLYRRLGFRPAFLLRGYWRTRP